MKQLCVKPASKSKEFPSFHFQIFKNPDSKLLVKTVFGIVLDDWYHGPKDYEEKLQMKIRHLFQQVIDKHFQTVAIPLEIGERVPVLVMARACIRAFNAFQAERPGSILKRVSLCVVDTSCLPSLMDLFRSEFDTVVEDPKKASLDPLGVSALQREKQREDDNSNIDCKNLYIVFEPCSGKRELSDSCLTLSQTSPGFLRVCSTSLLKTLSEKEKLLVMSNFSFSHGVFYPFGELSAIFIKFKFVACKRFQFGSLRFVVWEGVMQHIKAWIHKIHFYQRTIWIINVLVF